MSEIDNLKNRIFHKQREWNVYDIWHYLLINYGWISFDEFVLLPAGVGDELVERLNKMNDELNKRRNK